MYGIFTYIWLIFIVNVGKSGKYTIHGWYGTYLTGKSSLFLVNTFKLVDSPAGSQLLEGSPG